MAIILKRPPPESLSRLVFWGFILDTYGITRTDVHAELDDEVTAGRMTTAEANRLRVKIDDGVEYDRLDPDILPLAALLGLDTDAMHPVSTQAELDERFVEALAWAAEIPEPSLFLDPTTGAPLVADAVDMSDASWTMTDAGFARTTETARWSFSAPQTVTADASGPGEGLETSIGTPTAGVAYRFGAIIRPGGPDKGLIAISDDADAHPSAQVRVYSISGGSIGAGPESTLGAWSDLAVDALGEDYYRVRGVWTPAVSVASSMLIGPRATGAGHSITIYAASVAAAA